ncbi:MAG TPA: hypothetical protein PK710_07015, partial [Polyangiaceae bacterium]|nr:hypothetical protein [Polyangiaceae bacterium]
MQASAITFAFGRSLLPFGIALLLGGCEPTPQPPPPPRPSASIAQQPTAAPAPPEPTVSGAPIALRDV